MLRWRIIPRGRRNRWLISALLALLATEVAWLWWKTQTYALLLFLLGDPMQRGWHLNVASWAGALRIAVHWPNATFLAAWLRDMEISLAYWWLLPLLAFQPVRFLWRRLFGVSTA